MVKDPLLQKQWAKGDAVIFCFHGMSSILIVIEYFLWYRMLTLGILFVQRKTSYCNFYSEIIATCAYYC